MKKGLQELQNIDIELIAQRTHLVHNVIDDILNKRFERLNPVKAKGFIKILEREFDADLSAWVAEFDSAMAIEAPEEKNYESLIDMGVEEEASPKIKSIALLALFAVVAGGLFYLISSGSLDSLTATPPSLESEINASSANGSIVTKNEPKEANATADENLTNFAEINNTLPSQPMPIVKSDFPVVAEKNTTKPQPAKKENVTEKNATLPLPPKKEAAPAESAQKAEATPNKKISLVIKPKRTLWVGIRYLDNNKTTERTISNELELNSSRDQVLIFGHGITEIHLNSEVIDPKTEDVVRYIYKDKKIRKLSKDEYEKIKGQPLH